MTPGVRTVAVNWEAVVTELEHELVRWRAWLDGQDEPGGGSDPEGAWMPPSTIGAPPAVLRPRLRAALTALEGYQAEVERRRRAIAEELAGLQRSAQTSAKRASAPPSLLDRGI